APAGSRSCTAIRFPSREASPTANSSWPSTPRATPGRRGSASFPAATEPVRFRSSKSVARPGTDPTHSLPAVGLGSDNSCFYRVYGRLPAGSFVASNRVVDQPRSRPRESKTDPYRTLEVVQFAEARRSKRSARRRRAALGYAAAAGVGALLAAFGVLIGSRTPRLPVPGSGPLG